jgi:hypothetical protein
VEGSDRATIQLPASARFESYQNFGYTVTARGGIAEVEVDLTPLQSREPFFPPAVQRLERSDPIARLAGSVTAGARTRYEAASRLLSWMARHIRYELDRSEPQDAASVLERRSGYCTGVARLTVALLEAVGIEAREVPGYVVKAESGSPAGYHRWVEIFYADRGWVFSDPLSSQHFVPATYVRLASESLLPEPEADPGKLVFRDDGRQVVDHAPHAPRGVAVRRNLPARVSGALEIRAPEASAGVAVLEGAGRRRTAVLSRGRSTFVGLEPGTYTLTVLIEGHPPRVKRVIFRGHVLGTVEL